MRLLYAKSKWEVPELSLRDFLTRTQRDGYDAIELYLPAQKESPEQIGQLCRDHGLELIAQINTEGATPQDHLHSLQTRYLAATQAKPLFVNSHTARDFFTYRDNLHIYQHSVHLSETHGIPLCHETHRSRPTGNGPTTAQLLQDEPRLALTADFSHWMCLHESDLQDQLHNVHLACHHTLHIHCRVGHEQGPQVPDPLAPEWHTKTAWYIQTWNHILARRKRDGAAYTTLTPEFGPPPYMPCMPRTCTPLADAWTINQQFMAHLKTALTL